MEPRIQYCTTSDGVSIAYAVFGEGPLLLTTPSSWESASFILQDPIGGPFYNPLAASHTVVRYDRRGTGLSDRDRTDFTLDSEVRDIEAVADSTGAAVFALMGSFHLGPAAISFTARHPDTVSHLILYGTFARGRDLASDDVKASLTSLVRSHWGMGSRTLGDITAPDIGGETQELLARDERGSTSGEIVARLLDMSWEFDVTELLQQVRLPTLVMHRRNDRAIPFRKSRELAAALPNAKLVVLDGANHWPWFGDSAAVLDAIAEFLGYARPPQAPSAAVHTILFTDVEGSTALTDRLGDAAARSVMREHERITRAALKAHGGSEVKTMGDGFMASFGSATKALACAIAIQKAFDDGKGEGERGNEGIRVRIGLNAGEPIAEDDPSGRSDLFGTAVIVAARIAAQAQGGEILVSDVVRQLVAGKGFLFNDRGEHALKGFEDPVRVWAVRTEA
jgi:class 3 adenylate cyclase/pimeloyl-ACP methyl ester carboxylesterase